MSEAHCSEAHSSEAHSSEAHCSEAHTVQKRTVSEAHSVRSALFRSALFRSALCQKRTVLSFWPRVLQLTPGVRTTYATGQRKFWQFCNPYPSLWAKSSPLPASERLLMLFVSWLAQSLSPASVVVYLASVRSLHIDQGFLDPTLHSPRLRRVLQGIRRSASRSRPHVGPSLVRYCRQFMPF